MKVKIDIYPNLCSDIATLSYQLNSNAYINVDFAAIDGKVVKHIKQSQLVIGIYKRQNRYQWFKN